MSSVVVTGVIAILAAGCGGSSSGGSKELSKDEFIKQADAICTKYKAQTDALPKPKEGDFAGLADFIKKGTDIEKQKVADVRALTPPKADAPTITAMLASEDTALTALAAVQDAAQKKDIAAITAAMGDGSPAQAANDAAKKAAQAYGFKVCGGSSS